MKLTILLLLGLSSRAMAVDVTCQTAACFSGVAASPANGDITTLSALTKISSVFTVTGTSTTFTQVLVGTSGGKGTELQTISQASASSSLDRAHSYLSIGGNESAAGSLRCIDWGWNSPTNSSNAPVYTCEYTGSTTGAENGGFLLYTRSSTSDVAPTERIRVTPQGDASFSGPVTDISSHTFQAASSFVGVMTSSAASKVAISSAAPTANYSVDFGGPGVQAVIMGGTITFAFANKVAGAQVLLILTQDATGSRTASWPTVNWTGGTSRGQASAPTLSTGKGQQDYIYLFVEGDGATVDGFSDLGH